MKFLFDSDAGRWTAKLAASTSKKHKTTNGYKVKEGKKTKQDKAKEFVFNSEEE